MLLKLSRIFLYASVFSVLIVLSGTFFPFIGGKYYFFRAMVEASLVCFLLWWAFEAPDGEVERRSAALSKNWLFRAVSVFVLMFLLATLFADDPKVAFWSNYERGEGGFQMLHYYGLFVLLGLLVTDRKDWMRLFKCSVVASVLMIAYGIAAAMLIQNPISFIGPYRDMTTGGPLAPTLWGQLFTGNQRFQGSLGNPAYVAPYLLFSMFYVLYIWFSLPHAQSGKKRAGYIALLIFFLLFFVLSQTRGGFLGLVAGIVVFFIYLAFSDPRLRKLAAGGLIILALLGALAFAFKDPLVRANVPGSRFLTISLKEQTASTRFWTWGSAWRGFKDRPLLGWGPENFSTVFDKYFDTRHWIPGRNTETWFDRAHSVVFDYLVETGIMGFLAYLGMFGAFWYELFARRGGAAAVSQGTATIMPTADTRGSMVAPAWPTQKPVSATLALHESAVLRGLMIALIVAYLVQGLILFDVLPIYMNLFIVLAFAISESKQH